MCTVHTAAHKPCLNVQLLLQPFLVVADGNLAIDVDDRHHKFTCLVYHLIAGNLVSGNIKIFIKDFVFVQQLPDLNAPGSGSGRIDFNLSRHFASSNLTSMTGAYGHPSSLN